MGCSGEAVRDNVQIQTSMAKELVDGLRSLRRMTYKPIFTVSAPYAAPERITTIARMNRRMDRMPSLSERAHHRGTECTEKLGVLCVSVVSIRSTVEQSVALELPHQRSAVLKLIRL